MSGREKFSTHDGVVLGGLLDYLPDREAGFLLGRIAGRLLAPGGELLVTNIGQGNPFRSWMAHCADWVLIERSEADVRELLIGAAGGRAVREVSVTRDGTGLALLGRLRLSA